jgi:hypothetical protein
VTFRDKVPKCPTKFNPVMQAEFPFLKPVSRLKHQPLAFIKMDELYDEHTHLQQYVDKSLGRREAIALPTEGRWLELLKSLNKEHRPIPNFSTLAQYALSIPGTSTEVESLFSIIKDVWGPQ